MSPSSVHWLQYISFGFNLDVLHRAIFDFSGSLATIKAAVPRLGEGFAFVFAFVALSLNLLNLNFGIIIYFCFDRGAYIPPASRPPDPPPAPCHSN